MYPENRKRMFTDQPSEEVITFISRGDDMMSFRKNNKGILQRWKC